MPYVRLVFAMVVAALIAPAAIAQSFDSCGTLERGVLTCWLLRTDDGNLYVLNPIPSGFSAGDRVHVLGAYQPGCTNFCQQSTTCVLNAAYSPCIQNTCRADFDRSGEVGVQDIFSFLAAYFAPPIGGPSPPSADFDQNGSVSVNDIFAFLAAFFTGCD